MKLSAVLGAILGASAVAAAPGTAKRRERAARLLAERQARKSGLMIPDINETDELAVVNGTKHVSYSQNVGQLLSRLYLPSSRSRARAHNSLAVYFAMSN